MDQLLHVGPAKQPDADTERKSINVLAYNFFQLPFYVPGGYKRPRVDTFFRDFADRFDVCCFTEVMYPAINAVRPSIGRRYLLVRGYWLTLWCRSRQVWRCPVWNNAGYIADQARGHQMPYFAVGEDIACISLKVTDGGLMTTSKLPITDTKTVTYKASGGLPDSLVANGCLYTCIELNGLPIHIYSSHLQSDTSLRTMGAKPGSQSGPRMLQVGEMATFMEQCQGKDHADDAVIICGDLNIDARNPDMHAEYGDMLAKLRMTDLYHQNDLGRKFADFPITLGDVRIAPSGEELPFETTLTQSGDYCTKQCVDYILFRQDAAGRVSASQALVEKFEPNDKNAGFLTLSDHYGVHARISVQ